MLRTFLEKVTRGKNLDASEMEAAMGFILEGAAPEAQVAGLLTGLRCNGESVEEIAAAARALRQRALRVETPHKTLLDLCGTGGDGAGTFNISTVASFVVAGAGLPVAKHGNRSISSRCGSADVLEALGVAFPDSPEGVRGSLAASGMAFLFAPHFHRTMRQVGGVRKALGLRTIFNVLGPLAHPAGATHQLMGVFDPQLVRPLAEVLSVLGVRGAVVVHGHGGLDEFSLSGPNTVAVLRDGVLSEEVVTPEDVGLQRAAVEALCGGDARENAAVVRDVLGGSPGPKRDTVLFNAAAAIRATETAITWKDAVALARASIDSGRAADVLRRLVDFSEGEGVRRRINDPCCGGGATGFVSSALPFVPVTGVSA